MGCIICDINKVINLDVLEKNNFSLKCFKKKILSTNPFCSLFFRGMGRARGRAGGLRARKGTALGAGSPGHVMKQDKLSFTCKE